MRTKSQSPVALKSGVCGCERGYTEVMTTHGFLDYCTRTPGVDGNKKADVKTGSSGRFRPGSSPAQDLFSEWTLRPVGPGTPAPNTITPSQSTQSQQQQQCTMKCSGALISFVSQFCLQTA